MDNTGRLIKIYNNEYEFLGSGHLLSMSGNVIKIKGNNLPVLDSQAEIIIEVYNELTGIISHLCQVRLASKIQLNALIVKTEEAIERRNSLKVRTDLSFYVDSLFRNDEDISKDAPNMKINILNLSIGGMLISSNYDLIVNDILTFEFQFDEKQIILLKATVIRIDKTYDINTKELSVINYGCRFDKIPSHGEALITKYLYDRQLQLYKNK